LSLLTSSAPASANLGSTIQIRCNFGAQLGCISAVHAGVGCSFVNFESSSNLVGAPATVAVFNCAASKAGAQDNYCNLFPLSGDPRCVTQVVKIQSTNVINPNLMTLKSSSAPASANLGSTIQIKCDFGAQLGCITAIHGGVGCTYTGFSGTVASFNCVANKQGAQDNYCNLVNMASDNRCTAQQNKITGTNVISNCVPKTCSQLGLQCGNSSDSCGTQINCGTCSSGQTCTNGQCVANCVPSCSGKVCGDNGCGGSCGTCSSGQTCTNGQCINSNSNALVLKSSSAPASASMGSTIQIKCDFGYQLGCMYATHAGVGCTFAGFSGTTAAFNCVASKSGAQDNYCNLFSWSGDSRCIPQTNKITGTNVVLSNSVH